MNVSFSAKQAESTIAGLFLSLKIRAAMPKHKKS
jgi:hypothetical protein